MLLIMVALFMDRINKLSKDKEVDLLFDFINAIAIVNDPGKASLLLQDLLSKSEVRKISKRLRIAKLLLENKTYRQIMDDIHCGFGVIAKMSGWLELAGDGIKGIINKLPKRQEKVNFGISPRWRQYQITSIWEDYLNLKSSAQEQNALKLIKNSEVKKKIFDQIQKSIDEVYKENKKYKK